MSSPRRLAGKVVLVTGGGSGIGRGIALLFAAEGADIALCGRRSAPIEAVAAEVEELGRRAVAISADVGNEEEVERVVATTVSRLGSLHVLVNNASVVGQVGPVVDQDRSEWDQALAINITGPMLLCKHAIPHMRRAGWGTIVNVSSNVGRRGFPDRAPYVCSKWALHGLTQTVALEVAGDNIRVNAICPGPVMTERLKGSMQRMSAARGITIDELRAEWEAESPMGRFATIEECARAALFFACDDSAGTTGQALNVTAGVVMS